MTYRVTSPGGGYNEGEITYTVSPVNDAPYVYDVDYYVVTDEDMTATVNFKAFDYEDDEDYEDGDVVIYTFESTNTTLIPVENITLLPYTNEAKQLSIEPAANKYGEADITIIATDTEGTETRLVFEMVVTSVNDLPQGTADEVTTNEDTDVTFSVLDNDYDVEDSEFPDDGLELTLVEVSQGVNGGVAVNAGGGQITYSPLLNDNGSDTLTYTLMDSYGETVEVTVNITINPVNDPPVAADDDGYVSEAAQVHLDLTDNDTDVEFDSGEVMGELSISDVTGNMAGSSVSYAGGVLTYTAPSDVTGTVVDELTYTVTDGLGATSSPGTATITVNNVPDTVTITRLRWRNNRTRVNIRATSSAPAGSATLTAWANYDTGPQELGDLRYRSESGEYRMTLSFNGAGEPNSITVTSDQGGSDTENIPYTLP